MRTVGIIGGVGPESTIEYYRLMVSAWRERRPDGSYPSIIINSIDLKRMLDLIGADLLDDVTRFLLDEIERLAGAGADFALIAANTPHVVFDRLRQGASLPLISIVEAACRAAGERGLKRLALLGTRFTMQGRFYADVFGPAGIDLLVPTPGEQAFIHEAYMGELVPGRFLPATRERFGSIIRRLKEQEGIEGVILGGTELPLLLRPADGQGLPLLDTTRLHVEEAVARLLAPGSRT